MSARRGIAATVLVILLLGLLAACGGSSGSSSSVAQSTAGGAETIGRADAGPADYVAPANSVCRKMLRQAKQLGSEFATRFSRTRNPNLAAAAPRLLFKPGVAVIERSAARMRAVEAQHSDPRFAIYVGLYDPLVQLSRLMLSAAEEGDIAETRNLQVQMEGIGAEQRTAARLAGIRDCQVDFLHALVASWSRQ